MADTIAAPPGWYYCRVQPGESHIQRYPVAGWRVAEGQPVVPLLAKPGEPGLVPPSREDEAALVGLCPPDRDYQVYFATEDVQDALRRLFHFLHGDTVQRAEEAHGGQGGQGGQEATVAEVEVPGVGKVPVRDARPPGQRQTADWIRRAWGASAGLEKPRLGSGGG